MKHEPDDIRAWQRLGPVLTTSGLLAAQDFARLARLGVRHVINLALPESPGILADEAERCAAAGMTYANVPIPFGAPDDGHFAAFCAALEAATGPVHVHCVMNWRVSACFYRLHRARGMPEGEARALMNRQWDPATSDHADAAAWAAFIGVGNRD